MRAFADKGFEGASLREIAADAGTTHGLIRHHFGTKDALWRAMVDHFIAKVEEEQRPFMARLSEADPVELLKGIASTYLKVTAKQPRVSKIIMNDCSQPGPRLDYIVDRLMPQHKAIEPVFKAVQKKGYLSAHDPESFYIFLVMLGSFPITLASFTNKFYRQDIRSNAGIKKHIARVIDTLFDDQG